jgi:hypothetical protein
MRYGNAKSRISATTGLLTETSSLCLQAQGVVKEVWEYMRSLGISLPEVRWLDKVSLAVRLCNTCTFVSQIPVLLVESPVLNEQCNAHKKTDTLMNGNKPVKGHVTRGLCLSEVSQIQHMVRAGKHAVPRVASIQKVCKLTTCYVVPSPDAVISLYSSDRPAQ